MHLQRYNVIITNYINIVQIIYKFLVLWLTLSYISLKYSLLGSTILVLVRERPLRLRPFFRTLTRS